MTARKHSRRRGGKLDKSGDARVMRETALELLSEATPQKFTTIHDKMFESFGSFNERYLYRALRRLLDLGMACSDGTIGDDPDIDGNMFGVGYLRTPKGTRVLRDLTATPCTAPCVADEVDDVESEASIERRFSNPRHAGRRRKCG